MQILWRPKARADFEAIWDHTVETWGRDQAIAYTTSLGQMIANLATFPTMARLRTEFTPPIRIHPFRAHTIIYLDQPDHIDIIRVLHKRSNWMAYLAE